MVSAAPNSVAMASRASGAPMAFITERRAQLERLASSFGKLSGTRTRPASGSMLQLADRHPAELGDLLLNRFFHVVLPSLEASTSCT